MKKYLSVIPGKIVQYFIDTGNYKVALLLSKGFIYLLRDKTPPSVATCFRALTSTIPGHDNRSTCYWHLLGGRRGSEVKKITNLLKKGYYKDSIPIFKNVLESKFHDKSLLISWEKAYSLLIDSWQGKNERRYEFQSDPGRIKILAAGMLRSGSSAVFDYLQQFTSVNAYKQEYAFIEEDTGLYSLLTGIHENTDFALDLTRFFFVTLFSYADFANPGEYKAAYKARKILESENSLYYVERINEFLKLMSDIKNGFIPQNDGYNYAVDVLLKAFGGPVDENTYTHNLLNNVIHIYNLEAFSLFKNSWLLCVFRDPRTTFIARQKEKRGYIQTAENFIEEYKTQRQDFAVESNKNPNKDFIKLVQFEGFVLSEDYRRKLAVSIGLDINDLKKETAFFPEISKKNVFLYENNDFKKEIALIEKELPEYCLDFSRIK